MWQFRHWQWHPHLHCNLVQTNLSLLTTVCWYHTYPKSFEKQVLHKGTDLIKTISVEPRQLDAEGVRIGTTLFKNISELGIVIPSKSPRASLLHKVSVNLFWWEEAPDSQNVHSNCGWWLCWQCNTHTTSWKRKLWESFLAAYVQPRVTSRSQGFKNNERYLMLVGRDD